MKYIDADRLRAEIESRKEAILSCPENGIVTLEAKSAIRSMAKGLLSFIDSLQRDEKSGERWQPCDEHFRALKYAIEYFKKKKNDTTHLEDLYNGLKKLS